jgi:hypothetical protein
LPLRHLAIPRRLRTCFVVFSGAGDQTKGLPLAKQTLTTELHFSPQELGFNDHTLMRIQILELWEPDQEKTGYYVNRIELFKTG